MLPPRFGSLRKQKLNLPKTQINLLGFDGEKKKVGLMSPYPAALSTAGNNDG